MAAIEADRVLRTRAVPECPRCGGAGSLLYQHLPDRLFGVPGAWNMRRCARASCRLLWLDPTPLTEDLPEAYAQYFTHDGPRRRSLHGVRRLMQAVRRGYLAAKYGAPAASLAQLVLSPLAYLHPGYKAQLDHEAMHLRVVPNGRLLDVGCGSGELLGLAQELGWQAYGVDLDATAVAIARRAGFRVHAGSLASAAFDAGSFDAITAFHVIEHVPEPQALLQECYRLLRPGGRLVLATPNPDSRGHQLFQEAWIGLDAPRHLQIFPGETLRRDVERVGFRVLGLTTTVHGSEFVYLAGRSIETSGQHDLRATAAPLRRLAALGFTYRSWLQCRLDTKAGDETVLCAVRER